MADLQQLALIHAGVSAWNRWRTETRTGKVDLRRADLSKLNLSGANLRGAKLNEANLSGTDLSGVSFNGAKLRRANLNKANLCKVDLRGVNLSWMNLSEANLSGANLHDVDLQRANLSKTNLNKANLNRTNLNKTNLREANLSGTDLSGKNFSGMDLSGTNLSGANLSGVNLSEANLNEANLSGVNLSTVNLNGAHLDGANLSGANLSGMDLCRMSFRRANLAETSLQSTRLQFAALDEAILTGAKLWETQRAGWSIKNLICARASWDAEGVELTEYAPGEFEKLYSEQPRIELFYKDGLSEFELITLPALLKHLATLHPGSGIRLKSIQEIGGGAKVSISVEDVDSRTFEEIKAEAVRTHAAQIALRDNTITQLEIENRLLLDKVIPRMLSAVGQRVEIAGPATNVVIAGGQASVSAQQHSNDLSAIQPLLSEIFSRREELPLADDQAGQLEKAIRDVQSELREAQPRYPVVSEGLKIVRDFAVNATGGAAGAALLTNWNPLLERLTHFIHLVG